MQHYFVGVLFGILWVIQGKYYNDNNPFYCRFGHVLMPFLGLDSSVCIVSLFDDKQSLYFIHLAEIISWVHVQTFESMHLLKSPFCVNMLLVGKLKRIPLAEEVVWICSTIINNLLFLPKNHIQHEVKNI